MKVTPTHRRPRTSLRTRVLLCGILLAGALVLPSRRLHAEEELPKQLDGVTVDEKLGSMLDLDLTFTDHEGNHVRLGKYFGDGIPVLLTLNYYRCKMLCSLELNGVVDGLRGLEWKPGKNFRVVTMSIDPRETVEIAKGKRQSYIDSLGRGDDVDWTFLVGDEAQIRSVAGAVGFRYRYDAEQDQYAHPAVIVFVSPEGKVSRYLYGINFPSQDMKFALMEASEGRVGSTVDRIILSCFHYDATLGKYGPFAFGFMRLGGMLTVVLLGGWLAFMWIRERLRRRASEDAS